MGEASLSVQGEVIARVEELTDSIAEATADLIRIPSVNPSYPGQSFDELVGGESAANQALEGLYRDAGCTTHWVERSAGRANLVGVLAGDGEEGRSLILNGHVDVVPPGRPDSWTGGDPFGGRIEGGRIFGRGASDQKAALVAAVMAVMALRRAGVRLGGTLILQSVVGEEVGEHDLGVNAVIEAGFTADAAIVTEPTAGVARDPFQPPSRLQVSPVSAGLLWMTLEVEGKAGHNNLRPELVRAGGVGAIAGVNAVEKGVYLLTALQGLEQRWGQEYVHPLFKPGHFSLHPGVIVGGPHGALVPFFSAEFCRIEYSILYPPDVPASRIRHEIEAFVRDASRLDPWLREHPATIRWNLDWEPAVLDVGHALTGTVARARRTALGEAPHAGPGPDPCVRGFDAVCDATYLGKAGMPAVICGPGSIQFAHAVDESVAIRDVVDAAKVYALAAIDWCGLA
jgi:acetylornithine deacetylase/succinyl-diaminopimelate desuccinylase-like protein